MPQIHVMLFKAPSEDPEKEDPYLEKFNKENIPAKLFPTLQFHFKNLNLLAQYLNNPEHYTGLIFTSPRCVKAVLESVKPVGLKDEWKQLKCFVVGESTAKLVDNELHLSCEGSLSGNLTNLVSEISKYSFEKPFLMPIGNLHKACVTNFKVETVEVYDTCEHENLKSLVKNNFCDDGVQLIAVFFSPSGFKSVLRYMPKELKDIKFVALGPTTAAEIMKNNLNVFGVCEKPSPDSLIKTISKLLSS